MFLHGLGRLQPVIAYHVPNSRETAFEITMDWQTVLGLLLTDVGAYSLYTSISDWVHGVNPRTAPVGVVFGIPMLVGGLILLGMI